MESKVHQRRNKSQPAIGAHLVIVESSSHLYTIYMIVPVSASVSQSFLTKSLYEFLC